MTDGQKRQYVSDLYSGPKWKKQVEKMPDDQIVAIYLNHVNDGTVPHHDEETPEHDEEAVEETPILDIPVQEVRKSRHGGDGVHFTDDDFEIY